MSEGYEFDAELDLLLDEVYNTRYHEVEWSEDEDVVRQRSEIISEFNKQRRMIEWLADRVERQPAIRRTAEFWIDAAEKAVSGDDSA